jgi:DNA invertase Pin-like site-specific DNA recombinase
MKGKKKGKIKTVGYLRVSTIDQNTEKFKTAILNFGNEQDFGKVDFVEEKVSGTTKWTDRKLGELIETLDKGSRIIVPELSRLARSTPQIRAIIDATQERGIDLYILKQHLFITASKKMDPSTKAQVNMFAMMDEFERDMISLRTKEALQVKKESGVKLGRPSGARILSDREDEIKKYVDMGLNKTAISKLMKVNINTLANFMKERKITR